MYAWVIRRRVVGLWRRLSDGDLEAIPLAGDIRFSYLGDHPLAAELHSAEELKQWLRALFERFPGLRFAVEEVVTCGPPWSLHTATRYAATQDERVLWRGAQFTHIRMGRVVREVVLPDSQAIAAACAHVAGA